MENELYLVVELQKNNGVLSTLSTSYDTLSAAWHKFYTTAAAASISEIDKHGVTLLDENGRLIDNVVFER